MAQPPRLRPGASASESAGGGGGGAASSSPTSGRSSINLPSSPRRDAFTAQALSSSPGQPHRLSISETSHRSSFAEGLRGMPSSPRSSRHPSFSQAALQELLNNPPLPRQEGNPFQGRDWRTVKIGEIIDSKEVRFVDADTSVEDATNLLTMSGAPNCVLIRDKSNPKKAIGTFDYGDLNSYLLTVLGLARPDEADFSQWKDLAQRGSKGLPIPIRDIKILGRKEQREPFVVAPHSATLPKAVEMFGSGFHRLVVVHEGTEEVVGILSQLRLVNFFWQHGRSFPTIEQVFTRPLRELDVGSKEVIGIYGDKPLEDALQLMYNEGITSIPVLDSNKNVIGNISTVDVRLLTTTASVALLKNTCIHFISVILSELGLDNGKDPYPVFHVHPHSTLAYTVSKLVATRSHRMWVVEDPSPHSSGPATPSVALHAPIFSQQTPPHTPGLGSSQGSVRTTDGSRDRERDIGMATSATTGTAALTQNNPSIAPPVLSAPPAAHLPPTTTTPIPIPVSSHTLGGAGLPGVSLSGRLAGVVSLTDVLNLFARASGLSPLDLEEVRRRRRRSSSSSFRMSMESGRSSSVDLSRSGSMSGGPNAAAGNQAGGGGGGRR